MNELFEWRLVMASREQSEDATSDEENLDDESRSESSSRVGEEEEEFDEGEDGYRNGGYHRVSIDDLLGNWRVSKKLGWGHFSTVWLVKNKDGIIAALKIQKSAKNYTDAARDEIKILKRCRTVEDTSYFGKRFIVELFESFSHTGPHGDHVVMVFEVLGDNLLTLLDYYYPHGLPFPLVRQITWQICAGLDFLHQKAKVLHCDLKLENVLIAGLSLNLAKRVYDLPCVVTLRAFATPSSGSYTSNLKQDVIGTRLNSLEENAKGLTGQKKMVKGKLHTLQNELEMLSLSSQSVESSPQLHRFYKVGH